MRKLSEEAKAEQAKRIAETPELMRQTEVAIFTMIGGGFLGASAVNQPAEFYIDSRVGRLPYSKRAILQAVEILAQARRFAGRGEEAHSINLLNLGVF